jgi:8-oxo-dGTP diphosphatase
VPSGHLEDGESVAQTAVREASEEVGVDIDPADLNFIHVVHHRNPEGQGRIGIFFTTTRWAGEPANREPHKCGGLYWVLPGPARPPANTVPYTAAALAAITQRAAFSLDGW